MTLFYTRGELGFRIAIFFGSALLAAAFSGLISYGVFQINHVSVKGWMWLFIIEGGMTVVTAFIAFLIAAGYGIAHLVSESGGDSRSPRMRAARCYSAAEAGFVFCTCVLVSGPIWAKPVWGAWWRWEPRLTTFLILWATYAAGILMRSSIDRAPVRDRMMSVYTILAALEIPIVYASVLFWRPESQFHPARIHLDSAFLWPLWISMTALTALFFAFWRIRTRIVLWEDKPA